MIRQKNKFRKTHWIQERAGRIFTAFLFLVLAVFLIFSNIRLKAQREQIKEGISDLSRQIEILQEEKKFFEAKISGKSDPENLEKEAREKFNLKKQGEHLTVIINSQDKSVQEIENEGNLEYRPESLLYKIRRLLGI